MFVFDAFVKNEVAVPVWLYFLVLSSVVLVTRPPLAAFVTMALPGNLRSSTVTGQTALLFPHRVDCFGCWGLKCLSGKVQWCHVYSLKSAGIKGT